MKNSFFPDFIVIPHQLILDKELEPLDRNLYGVIYWYENLKDGVCMASNGDLARMLNVSNTGSIMNSLTKLEKRGYILRVYRDKERKKRAEIRTLISFSRVSSNDDTISSNDDTLTTEVHYYKNNNNNNIYICPITQKVYSFYKQKINQNSRLTAQGIRKIKTRLKTFNEESLLSAIEKFSQNSWWMDNNSGRGIAWFFNSDDRIDQFLNLEVGKKDKAIVI